jgi:hypothetical protein
MRIATRHARQEGAHGRLMTPHQFAEGILVIACQNAGDEISIGKGHALLFGRLIVVFISSFYKPDNQKCHADKQDDPAAGITKEITGV